MLDSVNIMYVDLLLCILVEKKYKNDWIICLVKFIFKFVKDRIML